MPRFTKTKTTTTTTTTIIIIIIISGSVVQLFIFEVIHNTISQQVRPPLCWQ